jgi:signal transduction histidine kinase
VFASLAAVALTTGLVYALREVMPVEGTVIVYLIPVVVISRFWGLPLGALTSILSALAFAFFHLPPRGSLSLAETESWVALGVFLIIAVLTSALAGTARSLATEQAALRRVATLVARGVSSTEIFETVTREVGLLCGADLARMERYEADGTVTGVAGWSRAGTAELAVGTSFALEGVSIAAQVRDTAGPVRVDSFRRASGPIAKEARSLGIHSSVGCPIVVEDRLWGVIAASSKREAPFPPETESQIAEFTELVSTAIANAGSRAELTASRARVVAAADETRRRIERDLHDGAQQSLVRTVIALKLARRTLGRDGGEAANVIDEALEHAERANEELRELAHGILPAVLTRGGLRGGVDALASRAPVPVSVEVTDERMPPALEATAYFIIAEALTNAVKHARAGRVEIRASLNGGALRVEVRDDGVGGAQVGTGTGLVGLEDRAAAAGGELRVDSPPGEGTILTVTLPLQGPPAAATRDSQLASEPDGAGGG